MSKLRLNTHEIKRELRKHKELKLTSFATIAEKIGVTVGSLTYWNLTSVPDPVVMCYDISQKAKNVNFTQLVMMTGDNHPVLNLLKLYHTTTGKDIDSLILKD